MFSIQSFNIESLESRTFILLPPFNMCFLKLCVYIIKTSLSQTPVFSCRTARFFCSSGQIASIILYETNNMHFYVHIRYIVVRKDNFISK